MSASRELRTIRTTTTPTAITERRTLTRNIARVDVFANARYTPTMVSGAATTWCSPSDEHLHLLHSLVSEYHDGGRTCHFAGRVAVT